MSLCYSKVVAKLPVQVREVSDYNNYASYQVIPSNSELYLESTEIKEDKSGNLWIFCPNNNQYYEFYRKKINYYLIDIFPTIAAEVTEDCISGLKLFENHNFNSNIIMSKDIGKNYHVTSDLYQDDRDNIWIKVVEIDKTEKPYKPIIGWTIYKNARNNFTNLLIHGLYNILTNDGVLNEEKRELFKEYLIQLRFPEFYENGDPLQLFAKTSVKTANKKTFATVYLGENSINESKSGRKTKFSYKKRKRGVKAITHHSKAVVQNSKGFPKKVSTKNGISTYDYAMNYKNDGLLKNMEELREHYNFNIQTYKDSYEKVMNRYNRYKLADPNMYLGKGFPHVFFTRPDCNFFSDSNCNNLQANLKNDANILYAYAHKLDLLRLLTYSSSESWNWLLSNRAISFGTNDEEIQTDTYGKTYHGNTIAYGKSNKASKASGSISIEMMDTRELDVFHEHKLWTDYISNVYHGLWLPKNKYIWGKILDYACACYYIITAEDGETILFWSKYYGCFPVNIPSSSYSWAAGSPIQNQNLNITYMYSFKEDFNPVSLIEFNEITGISDMDKITSVSTYNPYLNTSGATWVGSPFIETATDGLDYYFKLKYLK